MCLRGTRERPASGPVELRETCDVGQGPSEPGSDADLVCVDYPAFVGYETNRVKVRFP